MVYQWYKNGNSLGGATNSLYRIANAQISDAGYYHVSVTNLYGSVISSNALLIVTKGGIVIAWGDDSYGETDVPAGLQNVAGLAGGVGHTLALLVCGVVLVLAMDETRQEGAFWFENVRVKRQPYKARR